MNGRHRFGPLLVLAAILAFPTGARAQDDPEARWLAFRDQVEPALVARRMTAEARMEAARRQRAGDLSLGEAFPALADAPPRLAGLARGPAVRTRRARGATRAGGTAGVTLAR